MAEENQTTAVVQAPITYYYSDPDALDQKLHCLEIPSFVDLTQTKDGLPWHWHTEKPDESLKDPIWSNDTNGWVENSKTSQASIIAEATQAIEALDAKAKEFDDKNSQLSQALTQFQQVQTASSSQSQLIAKQLGAMSEQNANIMKMMMAMQATIQSIKPASSTTETTTTQGGNK